MVRDKHDWYKGDQMPKAIIARRRKETNRKDGSYIKFDDNAFVVIAKNKAKGHHCKDAEGDEQEGRELHQVRRQRLCGHCQEQGQRPSLQGCGRRRTGRTGATSSSTTTPLWSL